MLNLHTVSKYEDFCNLKEEWNELLTKSSSNCIFLTWEWVFSWWHIYGNSKKLEILGIRDNGRLIGIAPLCSSKVNILGCISLKKLEFMGTRAVASDHLDFIVKRGREQEVIENILETYLRKFDWDIMELNDVRQHSSSIKIIQNYFLKAGLRRVSDSVAHICPYINLPTSWDDYLTSLSSRTRKHIRHDTRVLMEKMGAEFLEWKDSKTLDEPLKILSKLHQERWTSRGRLGSFGTKRFSAFHKTLIDRIFPKGFVKIHVLKLHGDIIAVFYSFVMEKTMYIYSTGFDYNFSRYSPGTVLLGRIIEHAIREGITEFDFLRGETAYKYKWTKDRRCNKDILILKDNWKTLSLRFRNKSKGVLTKLAQDVLPNDVYLRLQKIRDYRQLR